MAKVIRISRNAQTTQEKDDADTFQNKRVYKPFDIVKVEKHGTWHYGMITETSGCAAHVEWFENKTGLYNAWWEKDKLTVVNNAVAIIANQMAHPFGGNTEQGDILVGIKHEENQETTLDVPFGKCPYKLKKCKYKRKGNKCDAEPMTHHFCRKEKLEENMKGE